MQGVLADMLDELAASDASAHPDTADAVGEAAATLNHAAVAAATIGGWTASDPLRLSKRRLQWLLRCPQRALIGNETDASETTRPLVLGIIVDAAAKLLALGAARPPTVDTALDYLDASGDTQAAAYLHRVGHDEAAQLRDDATHRLEVLDAEWPTLEPAWWPRVEEPVRVRLADGAVILAGKLDVLLGGPPSTRPAVVVEVKGGRWHDNVRGETQFYGLLTALRDGVAPVATVTLSVGPDEAAPDRPRAVPELIRPSVIDHSAANLAHALEVAAALAAGEPPDTRAGPHCTTCPLRSDCTAAAEWEREHDR